MRARFRNPPRDALPPEEAPFATPRQTFLSIEKDYEVYAVSVYKAVTFLQVVDDLNTPAFLPRALFEIVDPSLPGDWICNVFAEGPVQLVMGPSFMAKDLDAYNDLVDMRGPQLEAFWRRINWGHSTSDDDDG